MKKNKIIIWALSLIFTGKVFGADPVPQPLRIPLSKWENGEWVVYAILTNNMDLGKDVQLDLGELARVWSERRDSMLPKDEARKVVSRCRAQLLGYDMKMETVSVVGDQTLKLPKELDWKMRKNVAAGPRGSVIVTPEKYRELPPALVWKLEFE